MMDDSFGRMWIIKTRREVKNDMTVFDQVEDIGYFWGPFMMDDSFGRMWIIKTRREVKSVANRQTFSGDRSLIVHTTVQSRFGGLTISIYSRTFCDVSSREASP
jgi:hypothetical protein